MFVVLAHKISRSWTMIRRHVPLVLFHDSPVDGWIVVVGSCWSAMLPLSDSLLEMNEEKS